MENINVKQEFAKWLLNNAPDSYNYYLGNQVNSIIERLDEISAFFPDKSFFDIDTSKVNELIREIKFVFSTRERRKKPEFLEYDKHHSNGIPKAVMGKNNYQRFLIEKFVNNENTMNYWIFQGNPNIYDIINALRGGHLKSWKVAAHKDSIKPGDKVIIWKTGAQAGCYALAEVESEVAFLEEENFELQYYVNQNDKNGTTSNERVKLKITTYLADNPILWDTIKNKPEFSNFKAGNQGTNFSATKQEYNTLLQMAKTTRFSWVKTHHEITAYLLNKEDNQLELINLLKSVGIGPFNNDEDKNGNKVNLTEIDPFTFFFFIYKYGSVNRLDYLQKIARKLNITLPSDESGIPSAQAQKVWLFPYKSNRVNNEIPRLWNLFYAALEDRITDELFEDALNIRSTGKTKLTEGLFEVNPDKYFPVNGPTKPYLKEVLNIDPSFNTFSEYKNILSLIKQKSDKPFYQLSYEAWLWNEKHNKDLKEFKHVIESSNLNSLQTYFSIIDQLIVDLNIENRTNLVFSTRTNHLSFQVGKRYCLNLKNNKFLFIAPENYEIKNTEKERFAKPAIALLYKDVNNNEVSKHYNAILNAVQKEIQRDNHTDEKEYDNKVFRRAVFDKEYRATFFEFDKIKIKSPTDKTNKVMTFNKILFGPPGTGKTYGTISEAIKIIDKDFYDKNKYDREILTKRYRDLLITDWKEANGQIAFCTFHQSFTYEDFVEGIKPKTTQNKEVYYDIEPGVFKRICDLADSSKSAEKVKNEGAINWSEEDFRKAFFFKLSLGEANNPDDREIYEYCRDNGYISIGFAGAYDLSGKSETQIKQLCEEVSEKNSAGSQLSTFIHGLSIGDYVLISKGNYFVRALGKVIGDYEYHDDYPIAYNHFRRVEWVFTDENIPIEELYHTTLMQRSIYRIDHDKLKKDFFVKDELKKVLSEKEIKPYVLIVDEINRGNVASIFGELITLIEPDKRSGGDEELQVILPYSKEKFSVPDNLHIIGTMNTADRSIEALDSALRRRFSFSEVQPKPNIIDEVLKEKAIWNGISLAEILKTINKRITALIDRDHQIGHSYFLKLKKAKPDNFSQVLRSVFSENIIPLLQEYFFNDYVKIGMILGQGFIHVKPSNENLFAEIEDSLEDDYVDVKGYEFVNLNTLSDIEFKEILTKLLNK